MKVLIIGGGGREHALAWKLAQSPQVSEIYVSPGNAGTNWEAQRARARCVNLDLKDTDDWLAFAQQAKVELTIVGPEQHLATGIVNRFQAAGLNIFGPSQAAALLESSKAFGKSFMTDFGIPTAGYRVFEDYESAQTYIIAMNKPLVVKADGLAAGKGVMVCEQTEEALDAARRILKAREFGLAKAVVEERLLGEELSVLAFCDGHTARLMPPARDHKRALDRDQGENTGGMGVYAPVPGIDAAFQERVRVEVLQRTVDGMKTRGTPYVGVLYAGLMLTEQGYSVLEFNARLGDPETQALLPLLESDLLPILLACLNGTLAQTQIVWRPQTCAVVVAASGGYPGKHKTGYPIYGIQGESHVTEAMIFHAGTAQRDNQVVTAGGRVLAVAALGGDLTTASSRAYGLLRTLQFENMHYRQDIGHLSAQMPAGTSAYAAAGVNIDSGNRATRLMSSYVKATYGPQVLAGIGAFGGLYDVGSFKQMRHPVLVASTDGVGTKTKVASRLNRWDGLGADIVNHCVNDILVQGARPLFFLDYVASSRLDPEHIATVVQGVAAACQKIGCALLGGETAELPGVYQTGEIDLVGTIIGVVERHQIIDGARIQAGDVILGLASAGLHTNGYSLARQALDSLDWVEYRTELQASVADILLTPHRSYLNQVRRLQEAGVDLRGLAHITGGGLIENPPRILPADMGAIIRRGTWQIPPIFSLIQRLGRVEPAEMFRVFNMGLGMLAIVPPSDVSKARDALRGDVAVVGEVVHGRHEVNIVW
jgi:phosphoribosylamine--glycine ligase / phosphoribosylformylglycinamidine cyclo-ligase